MSWWVPDTPLEPGEVERHAVLANHSVGWRAVGGKLVVTDRRLVFRPNRVDRELGGGLWSVPLGQIVEIGRRRPTFHPFNGGLRSRLRIVTADGAEHLFVVNRLDREIETLQALRSR